MPGSMTSRRTVRIVFLRVSQQRIRRHEDDVIALVHRENNADHLSQRRHVVVDDEMRELICHDVSRNRHDA